MSYYEAEAPPPVENIGRGTVIALLAIPAGIIVWVIIWSIGFIASIVSFGVAYLALFLYRLGSGGVVSRVGAVRITVITLTTVVLAILAGLATDVALSISRIAKVGPLEALSSPQFGTIFTRYITEGDSSLYLSLAMAIGFGILGCFSILRNAFRSTATEQPTVPPAVGENGPASSPSIDQEPPRS